MKTLRSLVGLLAVALAVPLLGAEREDDVVRQATSRMSASAGVDLRTRTSSLTGRLTFLSVRDGRGVPPGDADVLPAYERAMRFLGVHGEAFGLGSESRAVVRRTEPRDVVGLDHVRLQQTYRGVPVTGGEILVHLRGQEVVAVNGKALPGISVQTEPHVSPERALEIVRDLALGSLGASEVELSVPELQVLNRGLLDGTRRPTHLAWFVVAVGERLREYVWVDAHRGGMLLHFNQRPQAKNRTVFTSGNSNALPGTQVGSEASPPTGDADAVAAFDHAGDAYDYFWGTHGRDSYDGAGGELRSSVHYCETTCPMADAFWDGTQMIYGEGYAQADDVVAHELTHAVTEQTANLFYYMQSGALSESFSDVFGEVVDLQNGRGTDTPAVRWVMGEDLADGAIRNMMDPNAFGDPARVGDSAHFFCGGVNGNLDGGGVHINSGVPNHAFALTVDGGVFNGQSVTGIGLGKAGKVYYRALTTYLMSASDFEDADGALRQSCLDLVGTSGITSEDCVEVGKALDAVELAQPWPCTPAQPTVPAYCPAGLGPVDLWNDNLENTTSGRWATSTLSGVNMWVDGDGDDTLYWRAFSTSGVYSFWGWGGPYQGDSTVEMVSGVTLPAAARLQFGHAYGFDNNPAPLDGGVLEYCTGACAAWQDAGGFISAGAAYNGSIGSGSGNPLGGRSAFTKDSWGYTASQLDLSTLSGESVRFRFRIGTDNFSLAGYPYEEGWFVDDVRFYQCPSVTGITPASGPAGTAVTVSGTGFTGATAVTFGGANAASFTVDSSTSITAVVSATAVTGPVRVTTLGGQVASATSFTVLPVISGFAPPSGPVATTVTLSGSGFTGATAVTFGGVNAAAFTVTSPTSITAIVSADAVTGPISVSTPGGAATSAGSFTVTAGCSYALVPASASATAAGGPGNLSVVTASVCPWAAATNDPSWISISSALSGTGSGSVAYAVAATSGPSRTGSMTVGGQTFSVTQASGCTYSLDPTSVSSGTEGAAGSLTVTTSAPTCPWTAVSSDSWITTSSAGTGSGTAAYVVAANVGPARTGSMTIEGQTFGVTQASGCTYSLDPTSAEIGGDRVTGSVAVTASATTCPWTALSNDAWITTSSSGTGSGTAAYTVAANDGPSRSGSMTIAGRTFVVSQGIRPGFQTVTPCRAYDSREAAFAPPLAAGETRLIPLAAVCGVPAAATAVSVNVTVVNPTAPGDFRVFPAGSAMPLVSALNYGAGQTRANNAVATLGANGALSIFCEQATGTADVLVDVNGYFVGP